MKGTSQKQAHSLDILISRTQEVGDIILRYLACTKVDHDKPQCVGNAVGDNRNPQVTTGA